MKRIDPLLLGDMLESIEEVTQAVPEARAEFDADKFRRSHILRHLQIIGEVAWRLSSELKRAHPEIPWKKIAGMRHALVHDYFEIDWHVGQFLMQSSPVRPVPMDPESAMNDLR